jgi:hypothetical protein
MEGGSMRTGHSSSCGCAQVESTKIHVRHGMHNSRPYHIWENMKQRCSNPKCMYYRFYGGRGIAVCERWLKFENFWEDMKSGYADHLTIDREDVNGNYEPGNCRWAPPYDQHSNTRSNIWIEFNGKKKTRQQWSREVGLRPGVILKRMRAGWSAEEALTTPVGGRSKKSKTGHLFPGSPSS